MAWSNSAWVYEIIRNLLILFNVIDNRRLVIHESFYVIEDLLFDDFCNFWLHWRKYLNQLQKFDIKSWHSKRKTHTETLIHFKSTWKPKLTKPTTNGPHTISLIKPSLPLVNSQLDRRMAVTSVRVSHFQEIRRTRFLVNFTEHLPTQVLHSAPEKNRVRGCGRYKHSFWKELKYFF